MTGHQHGAAISNFALELQSWAQVYLESLWVLWFPPDLLKYAWEWIATVICVNSFLWICMCVCRVMDCHFSEGVFQPYTQCSRDWLQIHYDLVEQWFIIETCCPTECRRKCECNCKCKLLCYTLVTHIHKGCQYIYNQTSFLTYLVMSFKQWYENQCFQSFCFTCFTQGLQNITGRSTAFTVAILELFWGMQVKGLLLSIYIILQH